MNKRLLKLILWTGLISALPFSLHASCAPFQCRLVTFEVTSCDSQVFSNNETLEKNPNWKNYGPRSDIKALRLSGKEISSEAVPCSLGEKVWKSTPDHSDVYFVVSEPGKSCANFRSKRINGFVGGICCDNPLVGGSCLIPGPIISDVPEFLGGIGENSYEP